MVRMEGKRKRAAKTWTRPTRAATCRFRSLRSTTATADRCAWRRSARACTSTSSTSAPAASSSSATPNSSTKPCTHTHRVSCACACACCSLACRVPCVVCRVRSIREAIRRGFEDMDREVIRTTEQKGDSSGSCAVVIILLYNRVFIAHAGDTRAVLGQVKGLFLLYLFIYLLYCFIFIISYFNVVIYLFIIY